MVEFGPVRADRPTPTDEGTGACASSNNRWMTSGRT